MLQPVNFVSGRSPSERAVRNEKGGKIERPGMQGTAEYKEAEGAKSRLGT